MAIIGTDVNPLEPSEIAGLDAREALNAEAGSGALTAGAFLLHAASELPLHRHKIEEGFYVLEGTGTLMIRDEEHAVKAGDFLLAPAWTPHGFRTGANETLHVLYVYPALNPWTEML